MSHRAHFVAVFLLCLCPALTIAGNSERERQREQDRVFVEQLVLMGAERTGTTVDMSVYVYDKGTGKAKRLSGAALKTYRENQEQIRAYSVHAIGYAKGEAKEAIDKVMMHRDRAWNVVVDISEDAVDLGRRHWEDVKSGAKSARKYGEKALAKTVLIYSDSRQFAERWVTENKGRIREGAIHYSKLGKSALTTAGVAAMAHRDQVEAMASTVWRVGKDRSIKTYHSSVEYVQEHGDEFKQKARHTADAMKDRTRKGVDKAKDSYRRNKHRVDGAKEGHAQESRVRDRRIARVGRRRGGCGKMLGTGSTKPGTGFVRRRKILVGVRANAHSRSAEGHGTRHARSDPAFVASSDFRR